MATKEQIFDWIYEPCGLPFTDAMQVAEVVATKLAEEKFTSTNTAICPDCHQPTVYQACDGAMSCSNCESIELAKQQ